MNQSFSMNYLGYDIILAKRDVTFRNGLGIVQATFTPDALEEGYYYRLPLIGIVDQEFKTIVPLFAANLLMNLALLDGQIFLRMKNPVNTDLSCAYQIERQKDGTWLQASVPFDDFTHIDGSILKVKVENNVFLYDALQNQILSPTFHFIGNFTYVDHLGEIAAPADYFFPYDEDHFNQLETYINLQGQIVAPYFDYDAQKYYDPAIDLEEMTNDVIHNMESRKRL